MNIRLQTKDVSSIEVLKSGLRDLEETANILDDTFTDALNTYRNNNNNNNNNNFCRRLNFLLTLDYTCW